MNQQKKIINNIKPCDIDVHFKYKCSNPDCGAEHWLLLKEAKTKFFKIVCECGNIYIPKRVSKLTIRYAGDKKKKHIDTEQKLSKETLKKGIQTLKKYGFDDAESEELIQQAFEKSKSTETGQLIKLALQLFGDNNHV
jgi:hypothetical protein